jgi:hypothetical protein
LPRRTPRPARTLRRCGQRDRRHAAIGFEVDQEVDVAVGREVVAQRAAEHREATNAVPAAEGVDRLPIGTESAEHVHALRCSHHRVTRRRGVQGVTERSGERAICTLDRVGVDPERHRRVGVAESAGDSAHVVPTRDRGGRGPVPQIVKTPLAVDPGLLPGSGPPPSDAIGVGGPGRVGEEVGRDLLPVDAQFIDRVDRRGVEGEGAAVAGLGGDVFDPRLAVAADDRRAAVDRELVAGEVGPLERGDLGPTQPGDRGKAQRDTRGRIERVRAAACAPIEPRNPGRAAVAISCPVSDNRLPSPMPSTLRFRNTCRSVVSSSAAGSRPTPTVCLVRYLSRDLATRRHICRSVLPKQVVGQFD